jgi:hypothetical protein
MPVPEVTTSVVRSHPTAATWEVLLTSEHTATSGYRPSTPTDAHATFSGSCLVRSADGSSESQTISGFTPTTYSYVAESISCSFQKQYGDTYMLQAGVTRDGVSVKRVQTEAEYGVVSFAVAI